MVENSTEHVSTSYTSVHLYLEAVNDFSFPNFLPFLILISIFTPEFGWPKEGKGLVIDIMDSTNNTLNWNIWRKQINSKAYLKHGEVFVWFEFCSYLYEIWKKKVSSQAWTLELITQHHMVMQNKPMHSLEMVGNLLDTPTTMSQLNTNSIQGLECPQVWVTVKEPETNTMDATGWVLFS